MYFQSVVRETPNSLEQLLVRLKTGAAERAIPSWRTRPCGTLSPQELKSRIAEGECLAADAETAAARALAARFDREQATGRPTHGQHFTTEAGHSLDQALARIAATCRAPDTDIRPPHPAARPAPSRPCAPPSPNGFRSCTTAGRQNTDNFVLSGCRQLPLQLRVTWCRGRTVHRHSVPARTCRASCGRCTGRTGWCVRSAPGRSPGLRPCRARCPAHWYDGRCCPARLAACDGLNSRTGLVRAWMTLSASCRRTRLPTGLPSRQARRVRAGATSGWGLRVDAAGGRRRSGGSRIDRGRSHALGS